MPGTDRIMDCCCWASILLLKVRGLGWLVDFLCCLKQQFDHTGWKVFPATLMPCHHSKLKKLGQKIKYVFFQSPHTRVCDLSDLQNLLWEKKFPSWNKRHVNNTCNDKARNKHKSPLLRESISQNNKKENPEYNCNLNDKRHYLVAETEKIHHLQWKPQSKKTATASLFQTPNCR